MDAATRNANRNASANAGSGAVYGLGFIGALVYFLTTAESLVDGLWGVVQAIFWPAFLVYGLFGQLGM